MIEKISNFIFHDDLDKAERFLMREPQGLELIASLLQEVKNKRPPLQELKARPPGFIKIATSYTCRLRCAMCGSGFQNRPFLFEERKYLTPDEFERLLPWVEGATNVIFSGMGETLDSPYIFNFLKKTGGKITTVITSGTTLNTRIIRKLIQSKLNFLHLSFDGKTSVGHGAGKDAYIRNFWRKVRKIQEVKKELKSRRPILGLQVTVNRENIENLDEIFSASREHKVSTVLIIPMTLFNPSLFEKSICSDYAGSKKRINGIVARWNKKGMKIRIMGQYKGIRDSLKSCCFVDNWLAFPPEINHPALCCGGINMPVKITHDATREYWNSFPFRYLRFLHFCSEGAKLPFACRTCWVTNLKRYSNLHSRGIHRELRRETASLYRRASMLKRRGQGKVAERIFSRVLGLEPESSLAGKAYFHLGEMKVMEKDYDRALSLMKRAVQHCFDHKKAFVYLYLLWMASGERRKLKRKKKTSYKLCNAGSEGKTAFINR